MRSKYSCYFWLTCLLFSFCWIGGSKGEEPVPQLRALDRVPPNVELKNYTKRWAVVVGINYTDTNLPEGSRKRVPVLKNAENDAQAFADLLIKHYGYEKNTVKLLLGKEATRSAIADAIDSEFLGKKSQVSENDSVLFFFAGHGYDNAKEQRAGELLPWDVKVDGDIPVKSTCIPMEDQVAGYMKTSPARHKLAILDCCHSGYIFNSKQQADRRSENDKRFDEGLFSTPAFQAIASCRGEEKASDGKDGHSYFTASILSALKVIPRQQGVNLPIKTSDLFTFLVSELHQHAHPTDQKVQWGSLSINQGEFHFFPDTKSNFSGYSSQTDDEMLKAIAMAPGTYGAWWFEEMPWFIPSLRSRILDNLEKNRGTTNSWVRKENLKKSAYDLLRIMENEPDSLTKMRVKHLKILLELTIGQSVGDVFNDIADELRRTQVPLESMDLHLLALIDHRTGGKDRKSYEKAIASYEKAIASYDRELQSRVKPSDALRLLCLADLGQFEFKVNNHDKAASRYQQALADRVLCPVPFQVFVLASEANAWQQLGRWGEADVKLDQAIKLAESLDARSTNVEKSSNPKSTNLEKSLGGNELSSPLKPFAYSRRAWAYMEQWKFTKAAEFFTQANDYLGKENDGEAEIVRFHNMHGLAMARRFTGDPDEALAEYRKISTSIRSIFSQLRTSQGVEKKFGDLRARLTERLVNTLERQADCNLFQDKGDLKEAADDLRRAIRETDFLPDGDRSFTKASQLYKLALALGKRSIYQDLDLALACLKEGDELYEKLNNEQKEFLSYKHDLACAIVQLGVVFQLVETEGGDMAIKKERFNTALSVLRKAIEGLMPQDNSPIHRDNLEVLLFATAVLITEDLGNADRYLLLADSELLLLLCRHAMRSDPLETQHYLRHYFDTAIRAKIAARPKHVQGIIEATYEARIARPYNKPSRSGPSLVFYYLDNRFHAFLDVPKGISKEYLFDEGVDLDVLKDAEKNQRKLPLPRQLANDLANLKLEKALVLSAEQILSAEQDLPSTDCLQIQWTDSHYSLGTSRQIFLASGESNSSTRSVVKKPISPLITKFPFALPGLLPESPAAIPNLPLFPKE
ncbi:MAG: caspase family protein [Planctomycetota bacterium]